MAKIFTPFFTFLLLFIVYTYLWISLCSHHMLHHPLGIDAENPVIEVIPTPVDDHNEGSKDVLACERVAVSGVSRLKLQHYASVYDVTLAPSVSIPKKWHTKIQICFHRNSSLGLCQCEKDDWVSLENGLWVSTMSPYEQKFVDVKVGGTVTGSVTVTLEEVQQIWRYVLLAVGVVSLFLAPIIYESVPFYYASSMIIGIITVVIFILYQARILLPTGSSSTFQVAIIIGAVSFAGHHLFEILISVLLNFGITPEIENLVYYFVAIGIILLGAGFGYWLLRKFLFSQDGGLLVSAAQFVKWSMFSVAVTCIFLSPKDNLMAMAAVGSCLALYHVIAKTKWCYHEARSYFRNRNLGARSKETTSKHGNVEFLSSSEKTSHLNCLINPFSWSNSVAKGKMSPLTNTESAYDVYSTFHTTPDRKKFSNEEWKEFTEESTNQSVAELTSSPEFTEWVIKNASRIKLLREDGLDDLDGSESSSTNEYAQQNGSGLAVLNRFMRKLST